MMESLTGFFFGHIWYILEIYLSIEIEGDMQQL